MQAVGASTGIVIGRAIIRDLYERERAAAMIGLVTTAMVIAPMVAPLIGGMLDTVFGWEAIFLFLASSRAPVLVWAVVGAAGDAAGGPRRRRWRYCVNGARCSASRNSTAMCWPAALGSAPFFTFLGGGPHVVVTLMGRTSAEYGVWFALTSLGYMSGNFTASRLSQRFGVDTMIMGGIACELAGAMLALAAAAFPAAARRRSSCRSS